MYYKGNFFKFVAFFLIKVMAALRNEGLESSNLILGIDFTKSNEWTGKW